MFAGCSCVGNNNNDNNIRHQEEVRVQRNMVLVNMKVFFLKMDYPEMLSVGFSNPLNSFLLPVFEIWFGSNVILM